MEVILNKLKNGLEGVELFQGYDMTHMCDSSIAFSVLLHGASFNQRPLISRKMVFLWIIE